MLLFSTACASTKNEKILFVPHDARPISYHQTVEVIEQLGYDIIVPPEEFFGTTKNFGNPDALWNWLETNADSASAAVISADSILYGGLIPSRKHSVSQAIIDNRIEHFRNLRNKNPNLKIYIFTSLMRTPKDVPVGFDEEPDYYPYYGNQIANLCELLDKQEMTGLNENEKHNLTELKANIPQDIFEDYFSRRETNLSATKKFIEFTAQNIVSYLIVGRDDNSPLGQTHRENRDILNYAEKFNLLNDKFQSLTGIDEFGLLLLTRAVNDLHGEKPSVSVRYNKGTGAATVPAYSDEQIGNSIESEIAIIGGKIVDDVNAADFVLFVNTDPQGRTYHTHNALPNNRIIIDEKFFAKNAEDFSELVNEYVKAGFPVGIADINFANGSDNALMKCMADKNLLFNLKSYAGCNTATNSTGFALGIGVLAKYMDNASKDRILVRRYLDDWAYQANVRTTVGEELYYSPEGAISYYTLGDKTAAVEDRVTQLMREFANKNLPSFDYLKDFYVTLPWNRMFECDIHFLLNS
ncbi:MAG: DUF4127 family protein [Selenomonadaceae bacterium]|nr:DUF4127 family protein [Selenomonadaceae bacterium]